MVQESTMVTNGSTTVLVLSFTPLNITDRGMYICSVNLNISSVITLNIQEVYNITVQSESSLTVAIQVLWLLTFIQFLLQKCQLKLTPLKSCTLALLVISLVLPLSIMLMTSLWWWISSGDRESSYFLPIEYQHHHYHSLGISPVSPHSSSSIHWTTTLTVESTSVWWQWTLILLMTTLLQLMPLIPPVSLFNVSTHILL